MSSRRRSLRSSRDTSVRDSTNESRNNASPRKTASEKQSKTASKAGASNSVRLRLPVKRPAPHESPLRAYLDKDIDEAVGLLFLHAHVSTLPVTVISPGPCSVRTYNDFNVKRITVDLEEGYKASEAIVVWKIDKRYVRVYGNQRYLAIQQQQLRVVSCLVIEGFPNPTKEDLEYASLTASRHTPCPAANSFLSHITEVRTIIKWLLRRGNVIGSIGVEEVKKYFPKPRSDNDELQFPSLKHWSHGKSSNDMISKVLHMAKTFMQGNMENVLDDIERTCFDPTKQVTLNSLLEIKKLEQLKRGAGKKVLERFVEDLTRPTTSRDENRNKKIKLCLKPDEQAEFNRLKEQETSSMNTVRNTSSQSQSQTNVRKVRAIQKFEKAMALSSKATDALKSEFPEDEDTIEKLQSKIEEMKSIVNALK